MAKYLIERSNLKLLGQEHGVERADLLVQWSMHHKPGQRWSKDFPFGLRLGFVAAGESPKVYLHWNQQAFNSFRQQLGFAPDVLFFSEYGICVHYKQGRTLVTLPGASGTKAVLWDSQREFCRQQDDAAVYWLLGMIRFAEEGPVLLDELESQQELEEATAVASIRLAPGEKKQVTKSPAAVLPSPQMSEKARTYLLQDVVTNMLLRSQGRRAG